MGGFEHTASLTVMHTSIEETELECFIENENEATPKANAMTHE